MKPPYPYFGGKVTIMPQVWLRLGDTYNLIDGFLGSNAPLLSRPGWDWVAGQWADGKNRLETVNDKDCYIANFQRALKHEPTKVAEWADDPINEADLTARHLWLIKQTDFIESMMTDPYYYDVQVAGWWVWGICQWIGHGWCKDAHRSLPHLRRSQGIHRVSHQLPSLSKRSYGMGVHSSSIGNLYDYFDALSARLRRVRVVCGDWSRVLGPTPTYLNGPTSVILDPPYGGKAERDDRLYNQDSLTVADDVREWAIANGDNPLLRIALFGYFDEHDAEIPDTWERLQWQAHGGYSNQNKAGNDNKTKETVWFSPHCLKPEVSRQLSLLESN